MTTIVELAQIKLGKGKSEEDLLVASSTFQNEFLSRQPGFVRRELLRKADGNFVDLIHWRSEADAKAIMDKVSRSPACAGYFSVMDMNDPAEGVDHLVSMAVYG